MIFVSDTHDPGRGNDTARRLLAKAQGFTVDGFLRDAKRSAKISSIKYHGIIPIPGQGKCGGESVVDGNYTYMICCSTKYM